MIDEEENLRQVGFKLTNTDVGTGIFNDIFYIVYHLNIKFLYQVCQGMK